MRLPLIITAIAASIIIILLTMYIPKDERIENTVNAIIEIGDDEIKFNDKFKVNGLELSELNVRILSDARSVLDALIESNARIVINMKSNDDRKEYFITFNDNMIKLEKKDDVYKGEYVGNIPKRLIIKGDKHIELNIKPLVREEINNIINYYEIKRVKINNHEIIVEIADTPEKKMLGLMYREYLPEMSGMLFILNEEQTSFWMMNMLINLDMIWIDANGKIIDITKNAKPCLDDISVCTYKPVKPVNYVLEVNAGFTDRYDIKIGDIIELHPL